MIGPVQRGPRRPLRQLRSLEDPDPTEVPARDLLRAVDLKVALSELSTARILSRLSMDSPRARGGARWAMVLAAVAISVLGLQVATAAMLVASPRLRHALENAVARRLMRPEGAAPTLPPLQAPIPAAVPQKKESPASVDLPAARVASPISSRQRGQLVGTRQDRPAVAGVAEARLSSVAEVEVMAKATRALYSDHDPLAALALLEPYLYLHAGGSLRPEMIVAAVQANLDLERTPEALGLLDGMVAQDFRGMPRADELRLVRAELLARSHRCREALLVFERSLAAAESHQRERALYGESVCRAELGDIEGSRAGLGAYLQQYPGGRFASEAARALNVAQSR